MSRSQAQESARKVCSPNRALYQLQSAMTRGGRVPTIDEVRAYEYERQECLDASERSTTEGKWQ